MNKNNTNYFEIKIGGMTCQSCEVLLEGKLKKVNLVIDAEVNHSKGTAKIFYKKNKPKQEEIKNIIEKLGYSLAGDKTKENKVSIKRHFMELGGVLILVLALFMAFSNTSAFSNIGIIDDMSFGFVFLIGIVAAFSSCLAVTGGLLVSVTANYSRLHPNLSGHAKFKPHIYFNIGRILGYTILGGLIGFIGSLITFSSFITGVLTIIASIIMILLGLQLIDIFPRISNKLKIRLSKSLSHKIMQKSENPGKVGPFFLGSATFFLPCGFTQALQLYVLSIAEPLVGALTMLAFSLGTLPGLLSLGMLTSFLTGTAKRIFFKTAGVVVILLGVLTIPNGIVLAGLYDNNSQDETQNLKKNDNTLTNSNHNKTYSNPDPNVRIENGVQIVEMRVEMFDYYPHQFTIYNNMPVEWQIDASKAAGCAKVLTVPKLKINEYLKADNSNVIKFTPNKIQDLDFMCSMAMTTRGAKFKVIENPY